MTMDDKPLNPRQAAFAREYLVDRNGTQAVIRAGYSPRGADVTAVRLLADPRVAKIVNDAEQDAWAKVGLTLEKAVSAVNEVIDNGTATQRLKAAEMALRRYGQFNDKVEVTGDVIFTPVFRKPGDA